MQNSRIAISSDPLKNPLSVCFKAQLFVLVLFDRGALRFAQCLIFCLPVWALGVGLQNTARSGVFASEVLAICLFWYMPYVQRMKCDRNEGSAVEEETIGE